MTGAGMTFEDWNAAFEKRLQSAREWLGGMQAVKALSIPESERAELIRILARNAKRGMNRGTT
jgi:hypothetical protein